MNYQHIRNKRVHNEGMITEKDLEFKWSSESLDDVTGAVLTLRDWVEALICV